MGMTGVCVCVGGRYRTTRLQCLCHLVLLTKGASNNKTHVKGDTCAASAQRCRDAASVDAHAWGRKA